MVKRLLETNPARRLTADQALEHAWFVEQVLPAPTREPAPVAAPRLRIQPDRACKQKRGSDQPAPQPAEQQHQETPSPPAVPLRRNPWRACRGEEAA